MGLLTTIGMKCSTDKAFWHRYTDFYEPYFVTLAHLPDLRILEFGVSKGSSIKMLLEYFKPSLLVGVDIAAVSAEWPNDSVVRYRQVDQDDKRAIIEMYAQMGIRFHLVIDDGGHQHRQQFNSLAASYKHIEPGGLYIIEDIQTSVTFRKRPFGGGNAVIDPGSPLAYMYHLQSRLSSQGGLTAKTSFKSDYLSSLEADEIAEVVSGAEVYRRANLPFKCWKCGNMDFDLELFRCRTCGTELFGVADSMTAVLRIATAERVA